MEQDKVKGTTDGRRQTTETKKEGRMMIDLRTPQMLVAWIEWLGLN